MLSNITTRGGDQSRRMHEERRERLEASLNDLLLLQALLHFRLFQQVKQNTIIYKVKTKVIQSDYPTFENKVW